MSIQFKICTMLQTYIQIYHNKKTFSYTLEIIVKNSIRLGGERVNNEKWAHSYSITGSTSLCLWLLFIGYSDCIGVLLKWKWIVLKKKYKIKYKKHEVEYHNNTNNIIFVALIYYVIYSHLFSFLKTQLKDTNI